MPRPDMNAIEARMKLAFREEPCRLEDEQEAQLLSAADVPALLAYIELEGRLEDTVGQINRVWNLVAYVKRDPQPHPEHDHLCPDDVLKAFDGELEGQREPALVEQVNQLSAQIERETAALNGLRWKIGQLRGLGDALIREAGTFSSAEAAMLRYAVRRMLAALDGEPESEATDA